MVPALSCRSYLAPNNDSVHLNLKKRFQRDNTKEWANQFYMAPRANCAIIFVTCYALVRPLSHVHGRTGTEFLQILVLFYTGNAPFRYTPVAARPQLSLISK